MKRTYAIALNRPSRLWLLLTGLTLVLASCDDPGDVGLEVLDEDISAYYTDTVTVDVSTVLLDSVVTSGTGALLVGQYTDAIVGITAASAYVQVGLGESWTLPQDALFDSLRLVLPYSGYSYGDTTQALHLEVYSLSENISPVDLPPYVGSEEALSYFYTGTGLYNTSRTATKTAPLSTYTFRPRPTSNDSVFVPLPEAMGQEWLRLKAESDTKLASSNEFLDYFKGIRLNTTDAPGAVVGFTAAGSVLRLYYSTASGETAQHLYHDFPVTTGSTQYNQLGTGFGSSAFSGLVRGGLPVASTETADMGLAQAGAGIMIKIDFPHLSGMKGILNPALLNAAVLELYPIPGTTQYPYPLPASVALYETDQSNVPLNQLLMGVSGEEYQQAALTSDNAYGLDAKYQFYITEYLISRLSGGNSNQALLLAALPSAYIQTVNRLVVGGTNHPTQRAKLKLYFTKIQ
ncbi:DUF4270 domain-containing protein [Pontibacter sp. E15-1]|uniref:DUF4270 family protein n=1 Tax=Pontibacter sp. E15-1 TaxID=2919918 RepID=UPI001F501E5B|nr:DUF4270 family protein [Pontibacter sp. E15-1]MCJ8164495.1 DUF4270 domain-containing protein [Pontibacter sp. E15-1]